MKLKILLITVTLGSFALASEVGDAEKKVGKNAVIDIIRALKSYSARAGEAGNANAYLDEILAIMRPILYNTPGVDPRVMPNVVIPLDGGGDATLYSGWMTGLSGIHRSADATLEYGVRFITFNGSAGWTNLQAGYKCQVENHLATRVNADAYALIRSVDFFFSATTNIISGEVAINDFNIYNIGQIDVDITGLAPFEWAAELIAESMINSIKDELAVFISEVILELLRQLIEQNPPPPPPPQKLSLASLAHFKHANGAIPNMTT